MSHTHLLYHIVIGTKDRLPMISSDWEDELHKYLGGIISGQKGTVIAINGMADHVHILAKLAPIAALSDLMRDLKANSSKWIRQHHHPKFMWQRRYGAFSVSESAVNAVRKYIRDQKIHHQKQTFEDEYKILLNRHKIEFDEKYVWD